VSGFCCGINEIFPLLGSYTAPIGSYRRFGTTYQSHLLGSSSILKTVPVGFPETFVTTNQRCVTSQKNEGIVNQLPNDVASYQLHSCENIESRINELPIGIVSERATKISQGKIGIELDCPKHSTVVCKPLSGYDLSDWSV
jgi:hypothetical protein